MSLLGMLGWLVYGGLSVKDSVQNAHIITIKK